MDRILNQILDACGLADELDRSLRNSAGAADLGYLLASCEDAAAAFQRATAELRDLMTEPSAAVPAVGELALECGALPLRTGDAGSSSRKRKEGTRTLIVPATRTGNPDNPPDDGYTWRKYGQKDILNSRFPRSYYRCTHKSFHGCPAKKQVQRLHNDPSVFEVTYRGTHTCQSSPTPLLMTADIGGDGPSATAPLLHLEVMQPAVAGGQVPDWPGRTRSLLGDGRQGGGRDTDVSVAELADAMFNSGSSSGGMDVIFTARLN
ncbi:WRKY transcription factor 55-like [Zingiber officinale]|uniref:WRKY domain-containing protein n=1 Tax=Zingiber officinale TaxID=94328 RepID=A0A8J5FN48_ZINOF|nr:WRKY transcription factor 55-like [Zingiber officinale]KAG6487432.1 hypothetical protein ZIOFF_056018 [Zingiber officinale]